MSFWDKLYRITSEGVEGQRGVNVYDQHEYNGVDFYHMMRQLDRVTRSVALEKHAIFVDLASHNDWRDTCFYDFAHMTPEGARRVGTLLYESLRTIVPGAASDRATTGLSSP